ncbi:dihydroxyacetone kinase subunit DhaK [Vibrio nigripulchritudo]|uniref:dihydroxyacetone kinase subunit DhaK n=1 Tax=Vibrio nigripulchritudo TaxID=28173 RepID=UPI00248F86AF|nr:dihydroxyacetone kinase subunit DhaK [Vibrio nigripulchritudo]BDU37941.1 dihydroxyacetone kinase [Vibrio nigripulchritudo]BDU43663.1 dihydroxyacetone kinase [Vibrio nigripulchritudo]
MSRFFSYDNQDVASAIKGLVSTSSEQPLAMLTGDNNVKVVVRADWDKSKVAILSGGGAGHEPAHVGFVGKGMLTGAVVGDVFASPSVDAVLQAIIAVAGDSGCLLIVKNYTGDRLNFGLAAEQARAMGYDVKVLIVGDDISLPDSSNPRGVAGTLFVHKIAGYLSETGEDLDSIFLKLSQISKGIHSIGLALTTCALPYHPTGANDFAPELGLGIHGEPGFESVEIDNARDAIEKMVQKLEPYYSNSPGKFAMLVNNLGSVSEIEMQILLSELADSELASVVDIVFSPGSFMTALNMYGFSISLIQLDSSIERALKAPVSVERWPVPHQFEEVKTIEQQIIKSQSISGKHENNRVEAIVMSVCRSLLEHERELNALDAEVGDGDTGTTFANAARSVISKLETEGLPLNDADQLLKCIGKDLSNVMGGSSGVLLSIFFTAASHHLSQGNNLPEAFIEGLNKVQEYGGARQGDRTMLDAAIPAFEALLSGGDVSVAAASALKGAESTKTMTKAGAGRSSYLREESLKGNMDPGAFAVAVMLSAAAKLKI